MSLAERHIDYCLFSNSILLWLEKQGKQKPWMIQWKGDNLKEVIGFTGKDKNFEKWFKSFEEYERYVHEHNDIFKLFNENGSHYEIPVGAWIVKTPDGYNIASNAVLKQKSINERAWLYLVSDVLTWKDGIGQYLDDPRVQELAKRLCSEYAQKLYNSSILSNSLNTGNNEQKSADKIEPKFKVGDWVVNKFGDSWHIDSLDKKNYQVSDEKGNYNYFPISKQDEMHLWTIQDAKDGDVIFYDEGWICIFKCIHGIWYSSYCFITDDGEFHTGYERHAVDSIIHGNAHPATKEQRDILMKAMNDAGYKWNAETKTLEKLVEPKFKVGDKFDPNTLQPFDKVLVRDDRNEKWQCNFFSYININDDIYYPYVATNTGYKCCIPYNDDTKHLVGTKDEAPEYYRYWGD